MTQFFSPFPLQRQDALADQNHCWYRRAKVFRPQRHPAPQHLRQVVEDRLRKRAMRTSLDLDAGGVHALLIVSADRLKGRASCFSVLSSTIASALQIFHSPEGTPS
jgi:hypothetical protein